jgi:hypothetical protein
MIWGWGVWCTAGGPLPGVQADAQGRGARGGPQDRGGRRARCGADAQRSGRLHASACACVAASAGAGAAEVRARGLSGQILYTVVACSAAICTHASTAPCDFCGWCRLVQGCETCAGRVGRCKPKLASRDSWSRLGGGDGVWRWSRC